MERFQQQKSDLKTKRRWVLCQGSFENMKGEMFPHKKRSYETDCSCSWVCWPENIQGYWMVSGNMIESIFILTLSAIFSVQFKILNLLLLIGSCSTSPGKYHAIYSKQIQSIFIFTFIVSRMIVGYESTQTWYPSIVPRNQMQPQRANCHWFVSSFFFSFFMLVYIYICEISHYTLNYLFP